MTAADSYQARALLADLGRRLAMATLDELRVMDRLLLVVERRREAPDGDSEGDLHVLARLAVNLAARQLAAEDREHAALAEAARSEIEWAAAERRTEVNGLPALIAKAERADLESRRTVKLTALQPPLGREDEPAAEYERFDLSDEADKT